MRLDKRWLVLLAGLSLLRCSTAPELYPRHALVDQILRVRQGHKGLTNRACDKRDQAGQPICEVLDYDLEDGTFRETANKLQFICNIGGRRFKVCLDKPGFCRIWYTRKHFIGLPIGARERHEEYLPVADYQFLLDSKARCFNKDAYPFDGID